MTKADLAAIKKLSPHPASPLCLSVTTILPQSSELLNFQRCATPKRLFQRWVIVLLGPNR